MSEGFDARVRRKLKAMFESEGIDNPALLEPLVNFGVECYAEGTKDQAPISFNQALERAAEIAKQHGVVEPEFSKEYEEGYRHAANDIAYDIRAQKEKGNG